MKRSRLRAVSKKTRAGRRAFQAVYDAVDARSGGRCEACWIVQATEHHHTRKPRRSFHAPEWIIHVCRFCHRRVDESYDQGRLVITPRGNGRFRCELIYAADKFAVRASGESA